jgi:acyl-CoA synthetase (AMP-forming)/AMP-acid ligase II
VAECAVVGVPDEEWGETVKAVVVMKPGQTVSADVQIEYCKNNLASYKKPRQVVFAESLPLTAVGKINRRALRLSGINS